jgi:hypothetical protein
MTLTEEATRGPGSFVLIQGMRNCDGLETSGLRVLHSQVPKPTRSRARRRAHVAEDEPSAARHRPCNPRRRWVLPAQRKPGRELNRLRRHSSACTQHVRPVQQLLYPSAGDRTFCGHAGTIRSARTWIESGRYPRGRPPFARRIMIEVVTEEMHGPDVLLHTIAISGLPRMRTELS